MTIAIEKHTGEAGQRGPEIRSDVHVHIEGRESGRTEIEFESRLRPSFGEEMRRQTEDVLAKLGVRHARVEIHDEGAVPFVISARIEAAAHRAGLGKDKRVLPNRIATSKPSPRDRLRRSLLYLPGSKPEYFTSAASQGADAVIFDLEDSVQPTEKDAARLLVRNALGAMDFLGCERMVRINQLPLGLEDLNEIVPEAPDLILIPKVESPQQIIEVDKLMFVLRSGYEITQPIWIIPILESALGIENAFAIAKASEHVVALAIGLEGYSADLGVAKTASGAESLYARQRVANAAHAAGLQAIDSVFGDAGDLKGLRAWGLNSRAIGFEGMGCVDPTQIPVIHEAFAPTAAEIEKARKIVAAYREAEQKGLGVVSLGAKMIDPPVVERALKLMARAEEMGLEE
jgi:citrate lyase subunit beta/citryl-CoA lyase